MNPFRSKWLNLLVGVFCATSFVACSDDGGGDSPAAEVVIPEAYQTLTFETSGGEQSLVIQSNVDLTATPSETWLTVESVQSTSAKMRKFNVICEPSADGLASTAKITITATGYTGEVSVIRKGGSVLALVSDAEINATAEGGTFNIVVSANEKPTIKSSDWWVTSPEATEADGVYTFAAVVAQNLTTSARSATLTVSNTGGEVTVTVNQAAGSSSDDSDMPSDAKTLIGKIYAGINIGNTMECTSGEGAWSGYKVNSAYVAGLKAAGFNAVRIPCAWHSYIKSGSTTYEIDATWMARVKEVVDYCISNGMYVVLNSHWDTGWLEDNIFASAQEKNIVAEQKAIWTQIATAFKDYDEHLIFSGCNEPGMNETSSGGKSWASDASAITRLVEYGQTFIDAVRATGGRNALRCLVFQGLGTDIANTYTYMKTYPTDVAKDRLIAEVHYYEPYQWALMENDASWGKVFYYWGKDNHKSGSNHNPTWGEESWVSEQFGKMKTQFVDNGIPVIIGEFSSRIQSTGCDSSEAIDQELHQKSRAYFNEVVTREAKNNGCAPFYWETGTEINRNTGAVITQYAIDGLMKGAEEGTYPW